MILVFSQPFLVFLSPSSTVTRWLNNRMQFSLHPTQIAVSGKRQTFGSRRSNEPGKESVSWLCCDITNGEFHDCMFQHATFCQLLNEQKKYSRTFVVPVTQDSFGFIWKHKWDQRYILGSSCTILTLFTMRSYNTKWLSADQPAALWTFLQLIFIARLWQRGSHKCFFGRQCARAESSLWNTALICKIRNEPEHCQNVLDQLRSIFRS